MNDPVGQQDAQGLDAAERIHFPEGILGFDGLHDFLLTASEEFRPFYGLVAESPPGVGFILAPPSLFSRSPYELPVSAEDRRVLQLGPRDEPEIYVIVNPSRDGGEVTANLKGPIVVNVRCRLAKQVVVYNPSFSLRAPLLAPQPDVPVHVSEKA